jgi:predicted  nucleic acid-binding Zn-ribbon protein
MAKFCNKCGDDYPDARHNLGYRTCMPCGDREARSIRRVTAPLNKSNYVLISNMDDLKQLNPKRVGE